MVMLSADSDMMWTMMGDVKQATRSPTMPPSPTGTGLQFKYPLPRHLPFIIATPFLALRPIARDPARFRRPGRRCMRMRRVRLERQQ